MDRGEMLVKALEDILLDGPIWRAQRIARETLAALRASAAPEDGEELTEWKQAAGVEAGLRRELLARRLYIECPVCNTDSYKCDNCGGIGFVALSPDSRKAEPVKLSDRDLWEAGCLTRAQTESWTDDDLAKHSAGIRKTLKYLFNIIDAALTPATEDGAVALLERAAKIADPWAGFWPQDRATEADKAVIEVRTKIAAAIRALSPSVGTGDKP